MITYIWIKQDCVSIFPAILEKIRYEEYDERYVREKCREEDDFLGRLDSFDENGPCENPSYRQAEKEIRAEVAWFLDRRRNVQYLPVPIVLRGLFGNLKYNQ
jgi:hypothetical protein